MKTSYKIPIIVVIAISGFIIWSLMDMVCKPCIIPPNAPENYVCPSVCIPEPNGIRGLDNSITRF